MEEKWMVHAKRADFQAAAAQFGVDQVIARLMRNRDVFTEEDQKTGRAAERIDRYLHGGIHDLYDPAKMKNLEAASLLLQSMIREAKKIRVIGDYDIDGVVSSFILIDGLQQLGADVDVRIPERIRDGYGLNENLVREAAADGREVLLTCDNGIAAAESIQLAKDLGMSVIVTDHHQIPLRDGKEYLPPADVVVDPHQSEETYPFHGLCGAGVAFKLICQLFLDFDIQNRETRIEAYLPYVAIATIGDVMELVDENRILVREGLKRLHHISDPGLVELIRQNQLEPEQIDVYHVGFILGPCLNASGRMDTAMHALHLLQAKSMEEASILAGSLISLNEGRKTLTAEQTDLALQMVETESWGRDRVLIIYLPDCHESLAGIIAGRVKEKYNKPTFVLTKAEAGVKGSGRSIEAYSMYEELCRCESLLTKFGGHPMAAGISLKEEDIEAFRSMINANCTLTEDDLVRKVMIDAAMPISYISEPLIMQLDVLKPFGNGNPKPVFAQKDLFVKGARVFGKNRNVCKMRLEDAAGRSISAVYFGDADSFCDYAEKQRSISVTYYPGIDTWQGRNQLQVVISSYR